MFSTLRLVFFGVLVVQNLEPNLAGTQHDHMMIYYPNDQIYHDGATTTLTGLSTEFYLMVKEQRKVKHCILTLSPLALFR